MRKFHNINLVNITNKLVVRVQFIALKQPHKSPTNYKINAEKYN